MRTKNIMIEISLGAEATPTVMGDHLDTLIEMIQVEVPMAMNIPTEALEEIIEMGRREGTLIDILEGVIEVLCQEDSMRMIMIVKIHLLVRQEETKQVGKSMRRRSRKISSENSCRS